MKNGYFKLVENNDGFGVELLPPVDGGQPILLREVEDYLKNYDILYQAEKLAKAVSLNEAVVLPLGTGKCPVIPTKYQLNISEDAMSATVRFIPASSTATEMTLDDFLKDLKFRRICFGIDMEVLKSHFTAGGSFCTDLVVAKGLAPVQGKDAKIEYCFDVDIQRKPQMREDGSVDYFNLTTINHCSPGQVLARIIPEVLGTDGKDILGRPIKPRNVKKEVLKFGRNIELSSDALSIRSTVNGHVSLVEDKVFVSNEYSVHNVDVSTGNIEFDGTVVIEGDVTANFSVKAGGDVIVRGVVEGAKIEAGGNIIIAKGMNGMGKGVLTAGGNVMVKFLENAQVTAKGYVETEAILHSGVSACGEVCVDGRKGLISGGRIQAGTKISAKTIGAEMGGITVLELGVNPQVKSEFVKMQKTYVETAKSIRETEVIIANFKDKMQKGVKFTGPQIDYMKGIVTDLQDKKNSLEVLQKKMDSFQNQIDDIKQAEVIVKREIYPGTTIMIGDIAKTIQTRLGYCRFIREAGDIKMVSM